MQAQAFFADYLDRLQAALRRVDLGAVETLALWLAAARADGSQVFLAGNGGSAANALHLANDLLYTVSGRVGDGLRAHALTANAATLTCLANDVGYEQALAGQLAVLARPGDLLVCLSGSGDSPNILRALEQARAIGVRSCAVLGYGGGTARALADLVLHVPVDDMQIAEDAQLVLGLMVMQWLRGDAALGAPGPG